jgi:hypothetical protein
MSPRVDWSCNQKVHHDLSDSLVVPPCRHHFNRCLAAFTCQTGIGHEFNFFPAHSSILPRFRNHRPAVLRSGRNKRRIPGELDDYNFAYDSNLHGRTDISCVTSPSTLGGTSGIVIDNQLSNGGTNIYFSTMAAGSVNGQKCNVSGGTANPYLCREADSVGIAVRALSAA